MDRLLDIAIRWEGQITGAASGVAEGEVAAAVGEVQESNCQAMGEVARGRILELEQQIRKKSCGNR